MLDLLQQQTASWSISACIKHTRDGMRALQEHSAIGRGGGSNALDGA